MGKKLKVNTMKKILHTTFESFTGVNTEKAELEALVENLKKYFAKVELRDQHYDRGYCSVLFFDGVHGNNKLYFLSIQDERSKNIHGDTLIAKGETIQKILNFNNNSYRTNIKLCKYVLDQLEKGIKFSVCEYDGVKIGSSYYIYNG